MPISPLLQRRLEIRGVAHSDDPEFLRLIPWLRTSFVLCGSLIGLASALAFTPLLWAMAPIAALGAIFSVHPFDLIYNHGIRRLTGTRPLPRNAPPTRFACGLAVPWIIATALAFEAGIPWLGYLLGGVLTSVAALVSITHFCIISALYQLLFGRPAAVYAALFGRERSAIA